MGRDQKGPRIPDRAAFRHAAPFAGAPGGNTRGLLVTTHNAGNMTAAVTRRRNVDQFLENLECYTKGLPMKHVVRRDLGY